MHVSQVRIQPLLLKMLSAFLLPPGVFLYSPIPQNVTVMFSSGVGVEVRGREGGAMALTVLLPTDYTNLTQGLLGQMNSDPLDDLLTSLGDVVSPDNTSPEEIFTFGASCECLGLCLH